MARSTTESSPPGISSRMRPGIGEPRPWVSPLGPVIEFPVIFDLVQHDPAGNTVFRIEVTLDLGSDGEPMVNDVHLQAAHGLDLIRLQREFRWATPLEAVTRLAPAMILQGRDPWTEEFPSEGFPERTREVVRRNRLTDAFLEDIAREYLVAGRGYAKAIAERHSVSPRTAVAWVEKARQRGILTATQRGRAGGTIAPSGARRPRSDDD